MEQWGAWNSRYQKPIYPFIHMRILIGYISGYDMFEGKVFYHFDKHTMGDLTYNATINYLVRHSHAITTLRA